MDPTGDPHAAVETGAAAGSAAARAHELRSTLGARRDVEAMLAEAGRLRDDAAAQADALVEEAQQIAEALVFESQQWAEQLTVEAHERAEEILARARTEAAATIHEVQRLRDEAEDERRGLARDRERSRGLVDDVEAALGRLRADLVADGSVGPSSPGGPAVRRDAGPDALFGSTAPTTTDVAPGEPVPEPVSEPDNQRAEPSLAELFPEAAAPPREAVGPSSPAPGFLVIPESERPPIAEVPRTDGPALAEVPAEVLAAGAADAGRWSGQDARESGGEAEVETPRVEDHDSERASARATDTVGSPDAPPGEETPIPTREGGSRPLGWLFRSQG